jgi:hypothetical protein
MPNFNPQETQGLEALLVALRGGLEPSTGYSQLQNIIGQQQQRVADRRARMGSLTDFLTQGAAQGQTFQQSKMLADVQTPGQGIPPMIQNAMQTLYPQQQSQGMVPDAGGYNMVPAPAPGRSPQMVSPLYTPEQLSPSDYQAAIAQQSAAVQAPIIASAFAQEAVSQLQGKADPVTGQQVPPLNPDQITRKMVMSDEYQKLDPQTQMVVLQTVQQALTRVVQRMG